MKLKKNKNKVVLFFFPSLTWPGIELQSYLMLNPIRHSPWRIFLASSFHPWTSSTQCNCVCMCCCCFLCCCCFMDYTIFEFLDTVLWQFYEVTKIELDLQIPLVLSLKSLLKWPHLSFGNWRWGVSYFYTVLH